MTSPELSPTPAPQRSSTSAIDWDLAALATRLTIEPAARATILEEIRGHLDEAAAAAVARGVPADTAEAQAVAAFGSVARTARSFNATLPVYWDWRRMALGLVLGVVAIWLLWTLITFPFLIQLATAHRLSTVDSNLGALLFSAAPLSFGLFYVFGGYGPWAALLIVLLFGAMAFVLGSRASHGWRAGLAFGLGVFVGLPFLPLSFLIHDREVLPALMLPFIVPIWLLVPYAVLVAWLGARVARARDARTLGRPPSAISANRRPAARGSRRLPATLFAGLALLVVLLAVNCWSAVRAATLPPVVTAPLPQQLASAQQAVSFSIRQPGYLPAGVVPTSIGVAEAWCGRCVVYLNYQDAHGAWLGISEAPHDPDRATRFGDGLPPLATSPDAPGALSVGTLGSYRPLWWLGGIDTNIQQTNIWWDDGTLEYMVTSNAPGVSATMLRQMADSLSH